MTDEVKRNRRKKDKLYWPAYRDLPGWRKATEEEVATLTRAVEQANREFKAFRKRRAKVEGKLLA